MAAFYGGVIGAGGFLVVLFTLASLCIFAFLLSLYKRKGSLKTEPKHIVPAPAPPASFDEETEVIVVGSGVLGSALGAVLARDGRRVSVIERDLSEPDRIVGELLQPGGFNALKKLGLEDAVEGIDCHVVCGYVVHDNDTGSNVKLSYPLNNKQETETGRSFHHGRFIMGLRREAMKEGATMIEGTALSLLEDERGNIVGVLYKDKKSSTNKTMKSSLTFVADGCFSKFRKGLVKANVSITSHFAGVVMHNCPQFSTGFAEIVLSKTGPFLVYQISSSSTRILVAIKGKMPANMKEYMLTEVAPQLPDHILDPFLAAVREGSVRCMPNCFLPPMPVYKPGMVLLGDALNMRHPLTGAGMSVALNDVLMWREMLHGIKDLSYRDKVMRCLKQFHWKRKSSHSFVVNILAQALYELFSASDEYLHSLRLACFKYFKLGGRAVSGPVELLSVLKPRPMVLIGHFFAVAFYSMFLTLASSLPWQPHRGIYRALMVIIRACAVIFPLLGSEVSQLIIPA